MPSRHSAANTTKTLQETIATEFINPDPQSPSRNVSAFNDIAIQKRSRPITRSRSQILKSDVNDTGAPTKRRKPRGKTIRGHAKKPLVRGDNWFRINGIIAHKRGKKGFDYLVSWMGYSKEHDEWLREDDITSVDIIAYWRRVEENLSKWKKLNVSK